MYVFTGLAAGPIRELWNRELLAGGSLRDAHTAR
jgi:hypothetical protein